MKVKTKKRPSLQDYDGGLEDKGELVEMSLIELGELLDGMLENKPEGRNRETWRVWRGSVNKLVNEYNERAGFKAYKNVK